MRKPIAYPNVYTVEEFAKVFKLSPEAVRNLIRKGEIPAIRIGKQYRIPQDVVDHYFAQAIPPEERGFGMWKQKPVASLTYVNKRRDRDRRTPEAFLKDMAEDE
ncbi:MAG: helix-turn-helix domain-containing protein [Candidatus Methylomirabilales bacterium]